MAKVIERKEIPLSQLYIDEQNVRKDVGDISELENSIEHYGVLEAITVRTGRGGKYAIVIGSRRFKASKNVGLKTIPAVVKELTDEEAFLESLSENLHRENLDADEEATAVAKLYQIHKSEDKVAKAIDMSKTWVHDQLAAKGIIDVFKATGGHAHRGPILPADSRKVRTIAEAGKTLFPDQPKKQIELFTELKDRPRDEVKRVIEHLKAKEEPIKEIPRAVEQVLKAPSVDISIQFDAKLSRAIIKVAEDRGITWEDVVRIAVEQWLKKEKYL
jgi:ParB family chromosome partitioning protein